MRPSTTLPFLLLLTPAVALAQAGPVQPAPPVVPAAPAAAPPAPAPPAPAPFQWPLPPLPPGQGAAPTEGPGVGPLALPPPEAVGHQSMWIRAWCWPRCMVVC